MASTGLKRKVRQFQDYEFFDFDHRNDFEHDYDRIIYSSSLRRLAEVTQIFNPSEGVLFHNRLTHTIKVSQIARRLTHHILKNKQYNAKLLNKMGGLHEEVVAAASLAHDLGNPPFGHAAEEELDDLIMGESHVDGFEGNAQSFRIVNKLACHGFNHPGMNLTRAVLNGMLKYPWTRPSEEKCKFGVYTTEIDSFNFAREEVQAFGKKKCLEAAIMDISDDISYGIHDLLDLVRSDLMPIQSYTRQAFTLQKIIKEKRPNFEKYLDNPFFGDFSKLLTILIDTDEEWAPTWNLDKKKIINKLIAFFQFFGKLLPLDSYRGTRFQKLALKSLEGFFITRFIEGVRLGNGEDYSKPFLYLEKPVSDDLIIIKGLTKNYIFNSPSLMKQQCGERKIISELFGAYREAINPKKKMRLIFPSRSREELEKFKINDLSNPLAYRIIGDAISSLTDAEAISTYSVLTGVHPGSVFDKISL